MVVLTLRGYEIEKKKKETREYKLILDQTFPFIFRSYACLKYSLFSFIKTINKFFVCRQRRDQISK